MKKLKLKSIDIILILMITSLIGLLIFNLMNYNQETIQDNKIATFLVCKTGEGDCEVLTFNYVIGEEELINELEKQLREENKFVIRKN